MVLFSLNYCSSQYIFFLDDAITQIHSWFVLFKYFSLSSYLLSINIISLTLCLSVYRQSFIFNITKIHAVCHSVIAPSTSPKYTSASLVVPKLLKHVSPACGWFKNPTQNKHTLNCHIYFYSAQTALFLRQGFCKCEPPNNDVVEHGSLPPAKTP